eukprot:TRINITY_DN0_c1811_g1_i1.p1 TRINITY_DN0_c1811_g1~~TRINITY_DN0_c1811_g1_i1.p1  ORF type:complete len:149 (+),score=32.11 TRINITY_DN0_c1811_g1_i1:1-447(+)
MCIRDRSPGVSMHWTPGYSADRNLSYSPTSPNYTPGSQQNQSPSYGAQIGYSGPGSGSGSGSLYSPSPSHSPASPKYPTSSPSYHSGSPMSSGTPQSGNLSSNSPSSPGYAYRQLQTNPKSPFYSQAIKEEDIEKAELSPNEDEDEEK